MAKKPKKAEGVEGAPGEAEAPKSKKKLVIIAAAAVLLLGGGGGAFVMKKRAAAQAETEHAADKAEVKQPSVFLDVREMVMNLSPEPGSDKAKFAKLRIALELKDAKVENEVKPLMPRVEDALQVYMRDMRSSDISGSVGMYRLREELLKRVNVAVYPAKVEAVLFKDVIVQ
ncbi:flagellar basal body-associated protein FliL [Methylobacterium sp. WL103]|uniref:flagellar basal body-associated protein FliL n=2 Tax=unclassified Methylobacterium TaxID=2615210 RepID=UPI0011C8A56D|nr:flagellar basal body-associated protein FliL [Methylobacterium sp. WL103]TXM96166.1 flagellar basal body-associated protein FliL [Methylobacterium sp. WL103]